MDEAKCRANLKWKLLETAESQKDNSPKHAFKLYSECSELFIFLGDFFLLDVIV